MSAARGAWSLESGVDITYLQQHSLSSDSVAAGTSLNRPSRVGHKIERTHGEGHSGSLIVGDALLLLLCVRCVTVRQVGATSVRGIGLRQLTGCDAQRN